MIKYFIDRKTNETVKGNIVIDDKNIHVNNKKINAIDYIVIECDECGKEEKAVFKRRPRYWNDKILCTKCHRKEANLNKYGTEWPTQSKIVRDKTEQTCIERYGSKVAYGYGTKEHNNLINKKYGTNNVNTLDFVKVKIKQTKLERYGNEGYHNIEKMEKTNLKKYGVKNPFQSEKIQNKIKQTMLNNWGVENPSQSKEIQNKIKENNLNKYGVESTTQLKEVKDKMKQTMLNNWGVDNPSKHPDIVKRRQETFIKNHGVTSIARLDKSKETMLKRYGTSVKNSCKWFKIEGQQIQGTFELEVANWLVENKIKFITHDNIASIKYLNEDNVESNYYPDFYLPEYNLYLEPHAKYWWDDKFKWKMKEVKKQVKILYFNEKYNIEEVLLSRFYPA